MEVNFDKSHQPIVPILEASVATIQLDFKASQFPLKLLIQLDLSIYIRHRWKRSQATLLG